jgi:hypothetical protein
LRFGKSEILFVFALDDISEKQHVGQITRWSLSFAKPTSLAHVDIDIEIDIGDAPLRRAM